MDLRGFPDTNPHNSRDIIAPMDKQNHRRMTPPLLITAVVTLAFCNLAVAQSAEQQIVKLENDWVKAEISKDYAALDQITANDFTTSGRPDGSIATKNEYMTLAKSGEITIISYKVADEKVRVYGNAAVATGLWTFKEIRKGKESNNTLRITDNWIKKGDSWQCVASQSSPVETSKN
jgi:ketosteroid isomerase-like protein